jgi:hypothetical protein
MKSTDMEQQLVSKLQRMQMVKQEKLLLMDYRN